MTILSFIFGWFAVSLVVSLIVGKCLAANAQPKCVQLA